MFPKAEDVDQGGVEAGVKIAVGSDAPAIPHGKNADELVTPGELGHAGRGGAPCGDHHRRRLDQLAATRVAEGLLADIIAVPGNPLRGHHRYTECHICNEGR